MKRGRHSFCWAFHEQGGRNEHGQGDGGIVHGMACRLLARHGELDPAVSPAEAQEALDMVDDLIVNDSEEDEGSSNGRFEPTRRKS